MILSMFFMLSIQVLQLILKALIFFCIKLNNVIASGRNAKILQCLQQLETL